MVGVIRQEKGTIENGEKPDGYVHPPFNRKEVVAYGDSIHSEYGSCCHCSYNCETRYEKIALRSSK